MDCTTDTYGNAMVGGAYPKLKVSMRQGDNYKIIVAYDKAEPGNVQVNDKAGTGYLGPNSEGVAGFKGDVSPLLTVWRKLNLEIDSMQAVPNPKPALDHKTFTNAVVVGNGVFNASGADSPDSEFYQDGYVVKNVQKVKS